MVKLLSRAVLKIFFCIFILISSTSVSASNLKRTLHFFDRLDKYHLELVTDFYDKNAQFEDPIHKLEGSSEILAYYKNLYQHVDAIHFTFVNTIESGDTVVVAWKMSLITPSINSGKRFIVDGASIITFGGAEGKVISHRDYFDMGQFVYERVSMLGTIIRYIRHKMAGH